jgi:DNA polymerase-3 subunit gamma/tau
MSYQVLARKWRPQTFSELVGQQHVVDAITNALENDKLHHAYLFTGTRGVGKTTIARIFSKSLNCEQGQSANPCGKCGTCQDISDGRFVDLLEIDAASRTKVEDTRELLDNVQYKPTRGKYKVYLIDEVHMLSKHSFNALLKTLEEPPEHVKFLLATTDPQKLPVTILSRCLQFSLKALSREQIQTQLSYILVQEKIEFEESALSQLARAAAGSMRDALSLADQAIAQGNNKVLFDTVVSMLGLLDKNQVLRLTKYIVERDGDNAIAQLQEICADSPDYAQVLSQLLSLLHQIALTQIVPDICKLDTNVAKPIYTLSQSLSSEHVQLLYQIALNGKRDLPFAPDPLTGLQMTVMRMLAFSPAQPVSLDVSFLAKSDNVHSQHQRTSLPPVESGLVSKSDTSVDSTAVQDNVANHQTISTGQLAQDPSIVDPIANAKVSERDKGTNTVQELSEISQVAPIHANDSNEAENSEVLSGSDSKYTDYLPEDHDVINDRILAAQEDELSFGFQHKEEQQSLPAELSHAQKSDSDNVARLQSLFDMEEDLQSYEQQMEEQNREKKSEVALQSRDYSRSQDSLEVKEVNKEPIKSETTTNTTVESSLTKELLVNDDEEEPLLSDPVLVATTFDNLSHSPIKPHLDNGEKLTLASQIDQWSAFIDALDVRGLARQLLIHGRSEGIKENRLTVEINRAHHHLNEVSSVKSIQGALREKYHKDIEIVIEYNEITNSPYELQQQIDTMRLEHAKQVITTDSSIQELLKAFDATIVDGSVEAR